MESVGSGMYIHIGTMKRGKGTVYHRVKVKKKGILIVPGAAIAEDGTPYGMAVRLCDSKKRSLEPYKRSYVSTEEFIVYGVDPGTYYIEVKNQSYYSISATRSVKIESKCIGTDCCQLDLDFSVFRKLELEPVCTSCFFACCHKSGYSFLMSNLIRCLFTVSSKVFYFLYCIA